MVNADVIKKENAEILTDLITANQERILGYAKAIAALDSNNDSDLISLFEDYSQQAQQFKSELVPLASREGEGPVDACDSTAEKLYKTWFDVAQDAEFAPRKTVLIAVTKGEKDNERIYRIALDNLEAIDEKVLETVRSQAELHSAVLENLKALLDMEAVL